MGAGRVDLRIHESAEVAAPEGRSWDPPANRPERYSTMPNTKRASLRRCSDVKAPSGLVAKYSEAKRMEPRKLVQERV